MTDAQSIKSIAPYTQYEVEAALQRLSQSEQFVQGIQYFYPDWTTATVQSKLEDCQSCADFQVTFIEPLLRDTIEHKMTSLEVVGLNNLTPDDHFLYISNHRDIFLDSGLLQYSLYHSGLSFTEISLGDNLIVNPLIETIAKLNNMFTVFRSGSKSELLHNARRLSAYLRYAVSEKNVSAWIAQGNGRSKDGNDKTFPSLINMLMLSAEGDYEATVQDLRIMVSTISYEYEPCGLEKAEELQIISEEGSYTKSKYEDMNSILKGVSQYKGQVKMVFEPLDTSSIDFTENRKLIIRAIANQMDKQMHKNYQLWKTNYMAYDLLNEGQKYQNKYSIQDLQDFQKHISDLSKRKSIQERLLKMYAKAVENSSSLE